MQLVKLLKMVECKFENCIKRASCNFPDNKKVMYCGDHKLSGMRVCFGNYCNIENCNKIANWNYIGEIKGVKCSNCKLTDMVDVKNTKCIYEDCDKSASYNSPGEKRLYCKKHSPKDAIESKTTKCSKENCKSQASQNVIGEKAKYCAKHSEKNMQDVNNQRCLEENCNKLPSYNYKDKCKRLYCQFHAKSEMINIGHKSCEELLCHTRPYFNLPEYNIGVRCRLHKTEKMVDVDRSHKRCVVCQDIRISNPIYLDHCIRCFIYTFPDVEISRNYKTKEKCVTNFINEKFSDFNFVFDKIIDGGCSKKRPDAYLDLLTHILIVEIDEHQHSPYENICENKRTMELFQDFGSRPIIFIRFNPDGYIDGNLKVCSSFIPNKINGILQIKNKKEWNSRLSILNKSIKKWIKIIPEKEVTNEFLFYDN